MSPSPTLLKNLERYLVYRLHGVVTRRKPGAGGIGWVSAIRFTLLWRGLRPRHSMRPQVSDLFRRPSRRPSVGTRGRSGDVPQQWVARPCHNTCPMLTTARSIKFFPRPPHAAEHIGLQPLFRIEGKFEGTVVGGVVREARKPKAALVAAQHESFEGDGPVG